MKRMLKKLTAPLIALILCMGLCAPAMAAETTTVSHGQTTEGSEITVPFAILKGVTKHTSQTFGYTYGRSNGVITHGTYDIYYLKSGAVVTLPEKGSYQDNGEKSTVRFGNGIFSEVINGGWYKEGSGRELTNGMTLPDGTWMIQIWGDNEGETGGCVSTFFVVVGQQAAQSSRLPG